MEDGCACGLPGLADFVERRAWFDAAPSEQPHIWEQFWSSHARPWRCLFRLALSRAAANPWQADAALAEAGASRRTVQTHEDEADEFTCGLYGRWLLSLAAVTMHGIRAHGSQGDAARARATVVGSICPNCGIDFWSRPRLLRNLSHGAKGCIDAIRSGAIPAAAPADVAANEHDRLERAGRRKHGFRDMAGRPVVRAPRQTRCEDG